MVWLVGVLLLGWMAWGPWVPVVAAASLLVPRIRWWVQDRAYLPRRVLAWTAGAAVALSAVVVAVPDGWLPIPPAPGGWATPSYVGRPATPRPMAARAVPPHPLLAAPATGSGPLGMQPEVDTSWFGRERCGRLDPVGDDRLLALCDVGGTSSLRLVDAETMRPTQTRDLPAREDACAREELYVEAQGRAVLATGDRQVLTIGTDDGGDELATGTTWDLKPYVAHGDCLVAVTPDRVGHIWWASADGLVGTIAPDSGEVRVIDLGEGVRTSMTTDEPAGVYVMSDQALHRLTPGPDGTPQLTWRQAYDSGDTAPVLLDGGIVAVLDVVDARTEVVLVARDTGDAICRQPVFGEGDGTATALAPLGSGVLVAGSRGSSSTSRTLLGLTAGRGLARIDLVDGECVERWVTDLAVVGSEMAVSRADGLVHVPTKRPSLAGVSAWYATAVDVETGRSMWSVRTGTGPAMSTAGSAPTIDAGGSLWIGAAAGLVRVRDRR